MDKEIEVKKKERKEVGLVYNKNCSVFPWNDGYVGVDNLEV